MNEEQFPTLARGIYANHAAISPWPKVTADAVAEFAEENAASGPEHYKNWIARERELRQQIAALVGASGEQDIALVQNTTEGLSTVAFGFPWQQGDNVVLPAAEFPTNRLPWLAQAARGVEAREVDIRAGEDPESALIGAIDDHTRVLAVSSVQYSDGLRLDLQKLGKACNDAGVLFCVDAIQQLGALPLNVEACGIDCLAAGTHKWMLGPEGMGIFYCREPARSKISLNRAGWHMYDFPWNFSREDWSPSKSARRFEAGSPNNLGQVALHASLALILDTGLDAIAAQVLRNTQRLLYGLSALPGVIVRSRSEPNRQSGIVTFDPGEGGRQAVFKNLMTAGVTCALREGGIRLSPHFYQDDTVIDRLLNSVEDSL